jgi:hypothetical protein
MLGRALFVTAHAWRTVGHLGMRGESEGHWDETDSPENTLEGSSFN